MSPRHSQAPGAIAKPSIAPPVQHGVRSPEPTATRTSFQDRHWKWNLRLAIVTGLLGLWLAAGKLWQVLSPPAAEEGRSVAATKEPGADETATSGLVRVPDLTGLDQFMAGQHLRLRDLQLRVGRQFIEGSQWPDAWLDQGVVRLQTPIPGTIVPADTVVACWLYERVVSGVPQVEIPDVKGMHEHEATEVLKGVGLLPMISDHLADSRMRYDCVISQYPVAAQLVYGGSAVLLQVARSGKQEPKGILVGRSNK